MSIRERLKLAYENVAYDADKTWNNELHTLQKPNMDLYIRESQLQETKNVELRPRTVRDCIPTSKLAKYSNYEYNNSRELSYTLNEFTNAPSLHFCDEFKRIQNKEPWMMEDVDNFFKWYINYHKHVFDSFDEKIDNFNCKSNSINYESPLLKINSLPEYLLKLQINDDAVKKIWDARFADSRGYLFRGIKSLKGENYFAHYKSASDQYLSSEYDALSSEMKEDYYEWCKDTFELPNDMESINVLSNSLKQHNEKILQNESQSLDSQSDSAQNRRLYSAVLQGFSSNKITPQAHEGQMTILRRNANKNDRNNFEKMASVSDIGKTKLEDEISKSTVNLDKPGTSKNFELDKNNLKMSTNRSVQTTLASNQLGINSSLFPALDNNFQGNRVYSHNYIPNTTPVISNQQSTARYRQSYVPNTYHYPSFYMFIQNSFQQQNYMQPPSFYNQLLLQRTVPTNFERCIPQRSLHLPLPPQYVMPPSTFINQTQFTPCNFQRFDNQVFKPKVKTKTEVITNKRSVRAGGIVAITSNIKKANDYSSFSSLKTGLMQSANNSVPEAGTLTNEFDELVSKTVNLVLQEVKSEKIVPVTGSHSDELERQALEQYNNSSDNVYQELERQAAEEYEDCPENLKNPPNCRILFGGLVNQCRIIII